MTHTPSAPRERTAKRLPLQIGILFFLLALPVFWILCDVPAGLLTTDHSAHIEVVQKILAGKLFPPHPLYHLAVILVACFQANLTVVTWAATLVLALAVGFRAGLTARIVTQDASPSGFAVACTCLALALATPLPNWWGGEIYGGQISPNVWHNPTALFVMPFCLLTFLWGLKSLESLELMDVRITGMLLAISALAKPNFLIAFAPVYVCRLAVGKVQASGMNSTALLALLRSAAEALWVPAVVLVCQYFWFFGEGDTREKSRIIFAPFAVWRHFSPNLLGSLLVSIAFPLLTLVSFPQQVIRDRWLSVSWATFGVALLQFVLLAESGDRLTHGNFGWGALLANHLLFVMTARFLLRQPGSRRKQVCYIVLGLHALTGIQLLRLCLEHPEIANLH